MRITENVVSRTFLNSINSTREDLVALQTQLATGKKVLKPSDDPQATATIMKLKSMNDRNAQHQRAVADATMMMEQTTTALDSVASVLQNVKEEVVKASNGTRSEALGVSAQLLDQYLTDLVGLANTNVGGRYIFGGTQSTTPPFTLADDRSAVTQNPSGTQGAIRVAIADAGLQQMNIDADDALNGTQFFDEIIRLRDQLAAGQAPGAGDIETVSGLIDRVLGQNARAGVVLETLDAAQGQLEQQQTQIESMLSLKQDADIAESIMNMKTKEVMLDSALSAGAQILPKSLLDFMG